MHVLEMVNISKEFPGVKALDRVNFKVRKGNPRALRRERGGQVNADESAERSVSSRHV